MGHDFALPEPLNAYSHGRKRNHHSSVEKVVFFSHLSHADDTLSRRTMVGLLPEPSVSNANRFITLSHESALFFFFLSPSASFLEKLKKKKKKR